MSYHVQNVQRVRAHEEANGSLGTDLTTGIATFTDIAVLEGSTNLTLERPTADPMTVRQNMYNHNEEVLMAKSAKFTFDCNLGPTDTMAASGATAAQTPAGFLLALTMGGENIATGTSVATTADEDSFTVDAGHNMDDGCAYGWVNANSKIELRELQVVSTNSFTAKLDMSATAATSDVIYACRTYYLDQHTSANVETLQFVVQGLGETGGGFEDAWCLFGGQMTEPMGITFTNGEIPTLNFPLSFADWDNGDDTQLTPVTAMGNASFSNLNEIPIVDSEFRCGLVGNATLAGTEFDVSEFTVELGYKYQAIPSPGGTNNVAAYHMVPDHPVVQGTFSLPYESQTFFDRKANKNDMYIFLQIGSTVAGGAMLISIPTVQITDVQRVDLDGIMGQQVTYKGRIDDDTTASTALANSPFRIHIF